MAEPTAVQDAPLAKLDAAAAPSAPLPDDKAVADKLEQLTSSSNKQQENNDDSDSEGDADDVNGSNGATSGASKKKKKKKPKKKKGGAAGTGNGTVTGPAMQQTDPPTIGITKLYPGGNFPVGEVSEYTGE